MAQLGPGLLPALPSLSQCSETLLLLLMQTFLFMQILGCLFWLNAYILLKAQAIRSLPPRISFQDRWVPLRTYRLTLLQHSKHKKDVSVARLQALAVKDIVLLLVPKTEDLGQD